MAKTVNDCGGLRPSIMSHEQFQAAKGKVEKAAKKESAGKKK